jgi:osmotically-inducible protein OsmY
MIRNGVVTLTGTVPDAFAAQAVRTVVHVIRGVVDIHDLLVVAAAG